MPLGVCYTPGVYTHIPHLSFLFIFLLSQYGGYWQLLVVTLLKGSSSAFTLRPPWCPERSQGPTSLLVGLKVIGYIASFGLQLGLHGRDDIGSA